MASQSGNRLGKVGCVFPMVAVSILPHAEFGPNDHRADAPRFNKLDNGFKSNPLVNIWDKKELFCQNFKSFCLVLTMMFLLK